MKKATTVDYKHPQEGYNVDNNNFFYYARYGKVVFYDPISMSVDLLWEDTGRFSMNVPITSIYATGGCFSGIAPTIGDIAYCTSSRGNIGSGSYSVVGFSTQNEEPNRVHGLTYDERFDRYNFLYNRILESGEVYHKSHQGSEVFLGENLILSNANGNRIELLSSESTSFSSFRNFHYSGAGLSLNFGMNRVMPFLFSGEDYSLKHLAPNELSPVGEKNDKENKSSNEFDSEVSPVILENGKYLYTATLDDSKVPLDEEGKSFVEFDLHLEETTDGDSLLENSNETLHEDFLKPLNDLRDSGHVVRFGVGTKLGKNAERKDLYARPIRRKIFKDEKGVELIEEDKEKESPILQSSDNVFSTGFWFNLFKKGKELAFFELDKSGVLRFLFDGEVPEKDDSSEGSTDNNSSVERLISSVEGRLNSRLKLSIGKNEIKEDSSAGSTDNNSSEESTVLPVFEQNELGVLSGESILGHLESSFNLSIDGGDNSTTGYFVDCKGGSHYKIRAEGEYQKRVDSKEKINIGDVSYHTLDKTGVRKSKNSTVHIAEEDPIGLQGTILSFVASTDKGEFVFGLGPDGKLNEETGEVEGESDSIKGSKEGSEYTINFGEMDVKIITSGKVTVESSEALVKSSGKVTVESSETLVKSSGEVTLESSETTLKSSGKVSIEASSIDLNGVLEVS